MDEFSGAVLGDPRLMKRLIRLVEDLSAEPTKSIPLACGGLAETKAGYRLLDEAVATKGIKTTSREPQMLGCYCANYRCYCANCKMQALCIHRFHPNA